MKWFRRNRKRSRTSWLWCFNCHHDLNGDNDSFVEERDLMWIYRCASCGEESWFSLAYPLPVRIPRG